MFSEIAELAAAFASFKTPVASEFLGQAYELLAARGRLAAAPQPGR